ncbi:DUF2252 domain-containing protein [Phycicoccus sp. CSK15P-2]|uniref:DUF2252 domain-containing protein n=1 Tax=Phycicoccus sp. CSK15P-2 TaxID=2807627 RepID=UPI001951647D|nr:DUF2252 family protein [Phycicoccus sp. CSK15P-2]MBM6404425.1 DUF2252 domain-containing protein [Phycicoccus sp. CSK15P-2]
MPPAKRSTSTTKKSSAEKSTARKTSASSSSATTKSGASAGSRDTALGPGDSASRFEAFTALAEARAKGEMVPLPRVLTGHDRRVHVRQTLREDHRSRISDRSEDARAKFDKLAGSLYSFFRGTGLLFYRDMAGEDAWMPTVLCLGDVHPENFGVMPSADNVPFFGVNDFDEAYYAPFTWDVKRGAVGFLVAAEVEGGLSPKRRRKAARSFVEGYVDGMTRFAKDGDETRHQVRLDNAPPLVKALLEDSLNQRSTWLAKKYHDEYGRGFKASRKLVPQSRRIPEFQEVVDRVVRENDMEVPDRAGAMKVKDVAARVAQGTASLGLTRYYVMLEGPTGDGSDDVILELKQARRSALAGLAPPTEFGVDGTGERITEAARVQLVNGDCFFGHVEFEDLSFMTRERSPYKNEIDLDELSKKEWADYARLCGQTLAHAHALSDDAGERDVDIEPLILDAIGSPELFVADILGFAGEAADRVRADHEHFRADHALGAFTSVDRVFR